MLCGGEFRNEHLFMRMDQAGHSREVTHNHELRSGDQHVALTQPEGCVPETEVIASTSAAPIATTPTSHPKAVPIRTSARVSKKVKLDFSAAPVQAKVAKKDEEAADNKQVQVGTPETKRGRRNWGLWSVEDKNTFFEALNEYGKDFDAIQAHFAVKLKKKSSQEAKNKDQVRHFYYRNWHKISKFIKFSVDLQKVTQELYALINFGELRKRIGRSVLDKNIVVKLHELIYHGFTLIKVRGKTVRVKTPVCRALRKLNMMDNSNTEIPKLPPRVLVELRPLNNDAWAKVHSTAQNPRARVSLPLQHRLATLITHMQHRWSQRDNKLLEKLAPGKHEPCPDMKLRVKPCVGSRISVLSVNINDILTSTSLSLHTYEERFLGNSTGEHVAGPTGKARNCCARKGRKKLAEGENKKHANKDQRDETEDKQNLDQLHAKSVGKILSLQLDGDDATDGDLRSSPLHMETEEETTIKVEAQPKKQDSKIDDHENCVSKIKAGWTIDDANTLTLGELYIMCGVDGKLTLDYCWERVPEVKVLPLAESSPPTPVLQGNAAQGSPNPSTVAPLTQDPSTIAAATLSKPGVKNLLGKLLSLAKILPLIKDKTNCTCGHVCGKPSRSQSNRQRNSKAKLSAHANSDKDGRSTLIQATTVMVPNTLELPPGTTMAFQPSPSPAVYQAQHSLHDGVFRRPLLAPSHTHPGASAAEEAFKAQLDQFRPKYCNRRGRVGRKNVVVQRMLPLLPKTGPSMLTLKMLPQTGEFRTINSQTTNARVLSFTSVPHHVVNSTPNLVLPVMTTQSGPSLTAVKRPLPKVEKLAPVLVVPKKEESNNALNNAVTPSPVAPPSPPSITTLLGLGTEELSLGADSTTLLDVPLANNPPNFVGLLSNEESSIPDPCSLLQSGNTTPPISPTRILRESDNQWLNSEVADFSLSSFLGHLDSPMKTTPAPTVVATDDTRLSQDVEAQLQCLMSESSVDYMAKFADLAAQIASDATAKK